MRIVSAPAGTPSRWDRGQHLASGHRGGPARGGLVIAELNPRVPYTYGDAVMPIDDIDYAIEADSAVPSPPSRPVTGVFAAIGERVAALVPDAATLQLGIGGVPDAVLSQHSDAPHRDGQRPGPDRAAAADDIGQLSPPGRPVRAGEREPGHGAIYSDADRAQLERLFLSLA